MGTITKPFTFAPGGAVTHSEWNSNFDTWITEFNGKIDNANIKSGANIAGSKLMPYSIPTTKWVTSFIQEALIDYTSVKILRTGPATSGNGRRVARGTKACNITAANNSGTITVTFSTDSDDGDPAFGSIPKICILIIHNASAGNFYTNRVLSKSATNFTFEVRLNAVVTENCSIEWIAIGNA